MLTRALLVFPVVYGWEHMMYANCDNKLADMEKRFTDKVESDKSNPDLPQDTLTFCDTFDKEYHDTCKFTKKNTLLYIECADDQLDKLHTDQKTLYGLLEKFPDPYHKDIKIYYD